MVGIRLPPAPLCCEPGRKPGVGSLAFRDHVWRGSASYATRKAAGSSPGKSAPVPSWQLLKFNVSESMQEVWPESSSENHRPYRGDRGFESISLQRRVCLSRNFIFVGKNLGFPRGCPGCVPGAVDREPQGPPTARQPGAISLSGYIPVPVSGDAVATSRWVKVARLVPNTRPDLLWLRDAGRCCECGIALKQSRARSADRARQAADGSARAASLSSDRAVGARRESLG